ncbi:MAG: hypothetical protein Q9184_007856 [Pyrenodesmia sp. 2 TL-2023]
MPQDIAASEEPPFSQEESPQRKFLRSQGFDLQIQQWEHVIAIRAKLERNLPIYHNHYKAFKDNWAGIRHCGLIIQTETHQGQAFALFCQMIVEFANKLKTGLITLLKLVVETERQIFAIHLSFRQDEDACDVDSMYYPGQQIRFTHCGKHFFGLGPEGTSKGFLDMARDVVEALAEEGKAQN